MTRITLASRPTPEALLYAIEKDATAFHEGSRNDDIVNWTLAQLIHNAHFTPEEIVCEFDELKTRLTAMQRSSLDDWEVCYVEKVRKVANSYDGRDEEQLWQLMIDQGGYAPTSDPNQTAMNV